MKLYRLKIEGFRRITNAEIYLGDTTFLIGSNNAGKSSVFAAIGHLLKAGKSTIADTDFHRCVNDDGLECTATETIVLEGEFRDLPVEANDWRGFRGRILPYAVTDDSDESGLSIVYRKTYKLGAEPIIELLSHTRRKAPGYENATKIEDIIKAGMPSEVAVELFGKTEGKLTTKNELALENYNEAWLIDETEPIWIPNPGGFNSIVASKLPTFILIPADDGRDQITGKSGALEAIMKELFNEVRSASENYKQAQHYLDALALELEPSDETTQFGLLMGQLNNVLESVFDKAKFYAEASLSKPEDAIRPEFNYSMSSNVKTTIPLQGSGLIRSAVFALLKFRQKWLEERETEASRGLLIGFEEPEIYLHPNAANQMRDTIYALSRGDVQIICTTHSPYMVDLSRQERQVLNSMRLEGTGICSLPFSLTEQFMTLQDDDKHYIKMLLRMDDHASRVFFADYVVVIEGDTEEIVLRETIQRMPENVRRGINCGAQLFKARGKPVIISLVKYLKSFGINPFVIHDADSGVVGAERFNPLIEAAVGDPTRVLRMANCIEDELGYPAPTAEKPFKAYTHVTLWGPNWDDVPEAWRTKMEVVFAPYFT